MCLLVAIPLYLLSYTIYSMTLWPDLEPYIADNNQKKKKKNPN